jgi:hypothetical protein
VPDVQTAEVNGYIQGMETWVNLSAELTRLRITRQPSIGGRSLIRHSPPITHGMYRFSAFRVATGRARLHFIADCSCSRQKELPSFWSRQELVSAQRDPEDGISTSSPFYEASVRIS